jgi:ribosomal-protein-alanine N-acetyltransferase
MSAPATITTQRLVGSRVRESDLPYIVAIDVDPEVQKTLFGRIFTLDESRARLERWMEHWSLHGFGFWVFRDVQGEPVGHAGLFHSPRDKGSVEVGYALPPAHWNQGYATEMTLAALKVGFENLRLPRIIAIAQPTNSASRRVMEKCGLRFDREFLQPEDGPSVLYAVERSSWRDAHGKL